MKSPSKTGDPITKGKANQCYNNARAECLKRSGSHYIVGWFHYIPKGSSDTHRIKHAWCEKDGVVYDSSPVNKTSAAEACSFRLYEPWAEYTVPSQPLDEEFPDGSTVIKLFPAARTSVWFGSRDFKKVPSSVRKLQGSTMKIHAKSRLVATRAEPTDGGAQFDLLNDSILDSPPEVQELTENDGSLDEAIEQDLLNDDLPLAR